MAQRNTSDKWTGPSAKKMIATHTLAKEIIARHDETSPVFDDEENLRLRRFVQDPSQSAALVKEFGMADAEGEEPGTGASSKGSLAGYITATHGTEKAALTEIEIQTLKQWFDNGSGKTSAEL